MKETRHGHIVTALGDAIEPHVRLFCSRECACGCPGSRGLSRSSGHGLSVTSSAAVADAENSNEGRS